MAFEDDGVCCYLKLERGEMMFDGVEQMMIALYSCVFGDMLSIIDSIPFCKVRFYKPQKSSFLLEIVNG